MSRTLKIILSTLLLILPNLVFATDFDFLLTRNGGVSLRNFTTQELTSSFLPRINAAINACENIGWGGVAGHGCNRPNTQFFAQLARPGSTNLVLSCGVGGSPALAASQINGGAIFVGVRQGFTIHCFGQYNGVPLVEIYAHQRGLRSLLPSANPATAIRAFAGGHMMRLDTIAGAEQLLFIQRLQHSRRLVANIINIHGEVIASNVPLGRFHRQPLGDTSGGSSRLGRLASVGGRALGAIGGAVAFDAAFRFAIGEQITRESLATSALVGAGIYYLGFTGMGIVAMPLFLTPSAEEQLAGLERVGGSPFGPPGSLLGPAIDTHPLDIERMQSTVLERRFFMQRALSALHRTSLSPQEQLEFVQRFLLREAWLAEIGYRYNSVRSRRNVIWLRTTTANQYGYLIISPDGTQVRVPSIKIHSGIHRLDPYRVINQ